MKRFIFYNILIIIALCIGCNKVDLNPVDGLPVFEVNAEFDGSPISFAGGIDEYYMFSSFEKDGFDVYSFTGKLASIDSANMESIEFHFRDFMPRPNGLPSVEEALSLDFDYADQSGNDTIWKVEIDSQWVASFNASQSVVPAGTSPIYSWSFGDGSFSSSPTATVSHTYEDLNSTPTVRLDLEAQGSLCSSFIEKMLDSSPAGNCNINLETSLDSNTANLIVSIQPIGNQPVSYVWQNGSTVGSLTVPINPADSVVVSVTATFANGCMVQTGFTSIYAPGLVPQFCLAQFSNNLVVETSTNTVIEHIEYADSLQLSNATISYTDRNGSVFRSDRQPQPDTSSIRIKDIVEYDRNEKGEKTKKLTVEFSCILWNEQGNAIHVTGGRAVIAVAFP